jgi:hypothetical protein
MSNGFSKKIAYFPLKFKTYLGTSKRLSRTIRYLIHFKKYIERFEKETVQLHICTKGIGLPKGAREIFEDMNKTT